MTGPAHRPLTGTNFAIGLPADPAARRALAARSSHQLPDPGPQQVVTACASCGGGMWIGAAQRALVAAGQATAACFACAFAHADALGIIPELLVAQLPPREGAGN